VRIVSGTTNIAAHDLYLRARFEHFKYAEQSIRRAIVLYDSAAKLDPNYADAYVGISQAWFNLSDDWVAPAEAIPHSLAASKRALALDSTSGAARAAMIAADAYNPDRAYVRREVEEAVRQAPNNPFTGLVAAIGIVTDDPARALQLAKSAYDVDSTLTLTVFSYGYVLHLSGHDDLVPGIEAGIIERDPPAVLPRYVRAEAEMALGRPREALADYQAISPYLTSAATAGMARAQIALGDTARALALLRRLESESAKHYVSKDYIAEVFAALGQRDSAFKWLEGAAADKSSYARLIYQDPRWKPLRGDPRLAKLANQIHVPVR